MNERRVHLKGLRPTTMGLVVGSFGVLVGLTVAIIAMIDSTVYAANASNSFLAALMYGVGVGALALLLVPAFYFVVGWVIGWLQGIILNAVLRMSGGLELGVTDEEATAPVQRATRTQPTFGETVDHRDRR